MSADHVVGFGFSFTLADYVVSCGARRKGGRAGEKKNHGADRPYRTYRHDHD